MDEFNSSDVQFRAPFRILLSGSSQCGKSTWIFKFLRHLTSVADTQFDKIIYVYEASQPLYEDIRREMPHIIWIRGYDPDGPLQEHLSNSSLTKLVIFDDQMMKLAKSQEFAELATTLSHHQNVSYLVTLQNLLYQGKYMRTIHLQTTAYILFKSPRDITQIRILGNQVGRPNLVKAYTNATQNKYNYLCVDLQIETPDTLRVRSGVLDGEQLIIFTE